MVNQILHPRTLLSSGSNLHVRLMHSKTILKLISISVFTSLLLVAPSWASNVIATVSSNKVAKNEVFQLRVVVDEKVASDSIDFSVLENDFHISRPSFGTSLNIINGDRNNRSEWNLSIASLRAGTLTIPSFKINDGQSRPITITAYIDKHEPKVSDLVVVENKLSTDSLYPDENAHLTSRLIIKADPRRLQNPKIVPPTIQGMQLNPIGEAKQYQSVIDGLEVTIVDQHYRITATKAGEYTLKTPAFSGSVIYGNNRSGTTRLISANTEQALLPITVKPKPQGYTGRWLPTSNLQLNQTWSDANSNPLQETDRHSSIMGDSLTRVITVDITGLGQEQFPQFDVNYDQAIRVYSEKPQFQPLDNNTIRMSIKQVLIAQSVGEFTLPDVTINWWNSQTDQKQTSTIHGLKWEVSANPFSASEFGANGSNNTTDPIAAAPNDPLTGDPLANDPLTSKLPRQASNDVNKDAGYWPFATGGFALLWLLTLLCVIRQKRDSSLEKKNELAPSSDPYARIKQVVTAGDPIAAQYQITAWLGDLKGHDITLEAEVRTQLQAWQSCVYNRDTQTPDSKALMEAVSKLAKKHSKAKSGEILEKL